MSGRSGLLGAAVVFAIGAAAVALAEEPKEPTAAERVKRVAGILEQMRGKKFKHDVGVETQTADEFRKFVNGELDKELPPEKAAALSKSMHAFELLPAGYDLRKGLSDLYVSQAGAYYNPDTKKFYLLVVKMPDETLDGIILHELMHALQDQHHELREKMTALGKDGNEDATAAFQFLVEGEATYIQMLFQLKQAGMDPAALGPMGDIVFSRLRDLDRKMLAMNASVLKEKLGDGAAEIQKALDAVQDLPGILFWSLHAPYFRGQYAIYRTQKTGSWGAVDGLFAARPASTEQMMHPEKLAGEQKDAPTEVALDAKAVAAALGEDWKPLYSNIMGELGVFILMDEKLPPEPLTLSASPEPATRRAKVSAGWDGDRYATFESASGAVALVWKTVWDSAGDAKEFAAALEEIGWGGAGLIVNGTEVTALRGVAPATQEAVLRAAGGSAATTGTK